jgi:hypothetical protein
MSLINTPKIPTLGNSELQGTVFYVDGNMVNDGGDGKSWASAYKLLATGLAAAHEDIGRSADRQWAGRNTVYVKGDAIEESLTKFAEKTDVIGVGSTNQHTHTRIDGTHVLEAQTVDSYMGCNFYNIEFYGAAAGIIVDIPADQNGISFHNCKFTSTDGATIGLRAVQAHDMKIIDCVFDPNTSGTGFATAAVQINAGSVTNFVMQNCRVTSDGIGLDFNPTTSTAVNCWCIGNNFHCVGLCIDSESDTAFVSLAVVDNNMITDVDTTTVTDGYDFVLGMAAGNILTGKDETDAVPYVLQT